MRIRLLVSMIVLAGVQAAAQVPAERLEVFVSVGASRMGGDEGSLGSGPQILGGIGIRLLPRVSIEVDVTRTHHEREIAGGLLVGTATGLFGNGVYHFFEGRTQIFVMGSVGRLRSETVHTFSFGGTPTTFKSDDSGFSWGGGAGLKVLLTPRLTLRPQFRLVFSEQTGVLGLAAASAGLGYHW